MKLPFKRILYPVDYSSHCDAIIPHVLGTAGHFSAGLTLVHAYRRESVFRRVLEAKDHNPSDEAYAEENRRLREFGADNFASLQVDSHAEAADPAAVIEKYVGQSDADLIMLATRGRGAVQKLLLGSAGCHRAARRCGAGLGRQ